MPYCEKCGNQLSSEAIYCRECGTPQSKTSQKSPIPAHRGATLPKIPIAGGIMTILGSLFGFLILVYFYSYLMEEYDGHIPGLTQNIDSTFFLVLVFGSLFGALGGISALSRKWFLLSIIGAVAITACGFIGLMIMFIGGLIVLIFGILGLIFISLSQQNFERIWLK